MSERDGYVRVLRRNATAWPAECWIGTQVLVGTVRDVTSKGAFFEPQRCVTDNTIAGVLDAAQGARPQTTVKLRLLYELIPDVEVQGEVRWSGVSDTHGCVGFGLEFTCPPVMLRNHAA